MKKERNILIYSMINNIVIALLKIGGGLFFKLGSLLADGLHTISDFITDVICMIGIKLSKKKPTKYHPFGFGKIEYLTNLFVGIVLLLLAFFIIIHGLANKPFIPPLSLLWILLISLVLKSIAIIVMYKISKKINSQVLLTSVKESTMDLYSSIGVSIVTILLQFASKYPIIIYVDNLATILIGGIILKTSFKIIVENSLSLIGEIEENPEVISSVATFINQNFEVEVVDIKLIKYGSYYSLDLTLQFSKNLSLNRIVKLEKELKRKLLRKKSLKIKYVMIYVTSRK